MKKRVMGGVFFVAILAVLLAVAAVAGPPQEKQCGPANSALAADRWDPNAAVPADGGQVPVKAVPAPKKSFGVPQVCSNPAKPGGGDDGLRPQVAPVAPYAPLAATVLWDQPLSTANQNAYVDQEFSDFPTYSSYLADDFTNEGEWSIGTIFVPGDGWNGFTSLMNATSLTWAIYAEQPMDAKPTGPISTMDLPDGYPGGGNAPYWTLTLAPTDPQVALSAGTPGGFPSNTTLTLTTPINLPAGTWWLYFYPTLNYASYGQYGRQASDTTNGEVAQFINPGGGFGYGTGLQNWTVLGAAQQDLAFRLETPSCPSYTYDNGPLVTHPGGGSGGADASALQTALGMNTYGVGHAISSGYRVADDFVVTDSAGWDVNTIQFYAYQTGSTTTSTINNINYRIWNGDPSNPASAVVFGDTTTNRLTGTTWSNDYRVLDTGLTATNRPIMVSTVSAGTHLAPGTYWLDWQCGGTLTSGPWAPPITILGQTTTGNAMQYLTSWAALNDTGTYTQQGLPFTIDYSVCVACPVIFLSPTTLPTPTVGVPYTQVITAYDGTGPYTFAVTAGTLPPGLVLAADGTLSGTLTALGDYSFTVTATDSLGCTGEQTYGVASFSAYFLDDLGRSKLCVNRLTGDYIWEISAGPGMGTYTGVANILNGGTKIYSKPGAPDYLNCTYDAIRKRAAGYYLTAAGDYSALKDYNTTNNEGGCFGMEEPPV